MPAANDKDHATTPATPEPGRLRDAIRDNGLATIAIVLVLAVAIAGWSASFISLHDFAMAHMGFRTSKPAWLVPATFDGAALGLSLLAFRAAIFGRGSIGSLIYVRGFTALSSWINWVHVDDHAGGKFVSCLLPISAVVVFGKVLKEARESYERRHGKPIFKVRPGLLVLRWLADRKGTRAAIRTQIVDIPVEALIGLGAGTLARDAAEAMHPGSSGTARTDPAEQPAPVAAQVHTPVPDRAAEPQAATVDDPQSTPAEVHDDLDITPGTRVDTDTARAYITTGWLNGEPAAVTAAKSGRSTSLVYREFKTLNERYGSRPRLDDTGETPLVTTANGTTQH